MRFVNPQFDLETTGLHADRDVQIKSDLHAEFPGQFASRAKLAVGDPLHKFDELDFAPPGARTQVRAGGIVGSLPFVRPFPPWPLQFVT